jgi:DNA-binding MarR family transcriptional regulator
MKYDSLKLENQLCFPLYVCSKEIIKRYKPFLDALDITYTQYITLMALWEQDNVTLKDIGEKLYLDSGTLTPLLKKMENQGLIVRQRSITDERNVYVKLTEKGIQLKEKALAVPKQIVSCVNLSKEEAKTLHELLNKLLDKFV